MQSNKTEREELQELLSEYVAIFQKQGLLVTNNLSDFVRAALVHVAEYNLTREHRKTLEARIQGAEMLADMVNAAVIDGKQSHSVSVIQKIVNRELAELQSQLPKKESGAYTTEKLKCTICYHERGCPL